MPLRVVLGIDIEPDPRRVHGACSWISDTCARGSEELDSAGDDVEFVSASRLRALQTAGARSASS